MKSGGRFRSPSEIGSKKREPQRSGSGKEVLLRTSSVKASGIGPFPHESEKHESWGMPAEDFKGHVTTDGSLIGRKGGKVGSLWLGSGTAGL